MATVEIVEIAAGLQIGGGGIAGDAAAIMPVITLLMLSVLCQQIKLCTVRARRKDDNAPFLIAPQRAPTASSQPIENLRTLRTLTFLKRPGTTWLPRHGDGKDFCGIL